MVLRFKIALFFLICLLASNSEAQSDWTSEDFPGSLVIDIIEKDSKYYAAVSNGGILFFDSTLVYQLQLFELDFNTSSEPAFFLNEVVTIPFENHYGTFGIDYIKETNRWLLIQTTNLPSNKQSYRALLLDDNFNILSTSIKDTVGKPLTCHIDTYQGNTFVLGSIVGPPRDELFYLKYDQSFPDVLPEFTITQTNPNNIFWLTSMAIDHRNGNFLVFSDYGINELNSQFTKVISKGYNEIHTSDHGTVAQLNARFLSHGATNQGPGDARRLLVLQEYDSIFNITFADTFGIIDQDNYPFINKSLDVRNNEVLIGGHLDGPLTHLQLDYSIKKFYVAKYDADMNKLWYKEFGGDKAYILYGLKLLDNGESMIYGYVRNLTTQKRYAYIMLLDENGDIKTSIEIPDPIATNIQIVNPSFSDLAILNPDGLKGNIFVYDTNGRLLLAQEFVDEYNEFAMDSYPSGIYPFQVFVEKTLVRLGKWVKN